ncbi:MAG: cyclodeaminase/cyclohydrolase family protein [Deltaproteobacteria bacterium]|jgi:formiminotetrahydrofolate cyclodeaminase|nr:cyclodeaminase/cyclohydrolase family protein [Deltaproteobacteria bacterium]
MFTEMKLNAFLDRTASSDPVPGGGSISALAAASAAGLVEMVANLTAGGKGFEATKTEMKEISRKSAAIRKKLSECIDLDSKAYNQVISSFKMPQNTEAEKKNRTIAIQAALKHAAEVPLWVASETLNLIKLAEIVLKKGNPNAVTDALVAVMMARTAILGALCNVKINLKSITDTSYVSKLSAQVREMETIVIKKEKYLLALVNI